MVKKLAAGLTARAVKNSRAQFSHRRDGEVNRAARGRPRPPADMSRIHSKIPNKTEVFRHF
jgi:hypothetical protein